MASRIGRHQKYVSVSERGGHRLDLWELTAICEALGVGLTDVIVQFEKGATTGRAAWVGRPRHGHRIRG